MAAVIDRVKEARAERADTREPAPKDVDARMKRGRERMKKDASKVVECWKFWDSDQYVYVNDKGVLDVQATTTKVGGGGKPRHRVRSVSNLIRPVVRQEVAYATQRVPSYQINPTATDPKKIAAARLAERIALYGYDKWGIRGATVDAVTHAVVGDEAFAWPFWDATIGPFVLDENENLVGQGEVRVKIFGRNQVYWEPGQRFEESQWHAIELAQTPEEAMAMEGYLGGKVEPDSVAADGPTDKKGEGQTKLVRITHYLEQPSQKLPKGRWLTLANKKQIVQERPYPVPKGLCLHKLCYIADPDDDRDRGLVRDLIHEQRIYNDATNKQLEAKNLGLNAQLLAPKGADIEPRLNDVPGETFYYNPSYGMQPQWRPPPPAELFVHLRNIAQQAKEDMGRIAAQNEVPSQVEAGKALIALDEKDKNARTEFIGHVAAFHSSLATHCLYLVQKHYTEPRLVRFRGPFGWENIPDFLGASLLDQIDVRVFPDSIEPRTRQYLEQKVQNMYTLGLLSPEETRMALNGGPTEQIVDSYEQDVGRAYRLIQRIKAGPQEFMNTPPRMAMSPLEQAAANANPADPNRGMVPGWMPRPFDNPKVHKQVFADYMKSSEFDDLEPPTQEAFYVYYDACEKVIQAKEMEAAQNQQAMAEGLGAQNAARPQLPKPSPSQPALDQGGTPANAPS